MGMLRRYELQGCAEQPFDTLSGGQQARFQILLLERSGATLLLLDEPTDNLDLVSAEALEARPGPVHRHRHRRHPRPLVPARLRPLRRVRRRLLGHRPHRGPRRLGPCDRLTRDGSHAVLVPGVEGGQSLGPRWRRRGPGALDRLLAGHPPDQHVAVGVDEQRCTGSRSRRTPGRRSARRRRRSPATCQSMSASHCAGGKCRAVGADGRADADDRAGRPGTSPDSLPLEEDRHLGLQCGHQWARNDDHHRALGARGDRRRPGRRSRSPDRAGDRRCRSPGPTAPRPGAAARPVTDDALRHARGIGAGRSPSRRRPVGSRSSSSPPPHERSRRRARPRRRPPRRRRR